MSLLDQALWWAAVVVGLMGTATMSGLETGIYRLNRVKLELRAARGPGLLWARLLKREVDHPERLLATNLVVNIFFGDLAAAGASALLAGWGYSETSIILINAAILTPVFFVCVESIPKELFRVEADRLTYRFVGILVVARSMLTWTGILPLIRLITTAVSRFIGGEGETGLASSVRERIATMLKETASTGLLSESQAGLVDRALAFRQTIVAREMIPWAVVRAIPVEWDRTRAAAVLEREQHTYFPLVERRGAGTRVVGVLRHPDLFLNPGAAPASLALEPARLPPRMTLREAVVSLRRAQASIGIVEDGGRPVGLVTMSDLIEPLLGEAHHQAEPS